MLIFREATLNDLKQLKVLEQSVIDAERPFNSDIIADNASYYDLTDLISNERSHVLVAEEQGAIVASGYIQIRPSKPYFKHNNHGYLGFMFVNPNYRGQGLNKRVLDNLTAWGKQRGLSDFFLDVYSSNSSAIRAYEKAGFTPNLVEMKLNRDQNT